MSLVNKVELAAATGLAPLSILLSGCGNVGNQYQTVEVFQRPISVRITNNPNIRDVRIIGVKMDRNGNRYKIVQYEDGSGKTHEEYHPENARD